MKRKIEIAGFLVLCCLVIAIAIRAGEKHDGCDKCIAATRLSHK
ncbi:MAG TPA: hypothetical protein VHN59_14310 [Chitinophagaceae bacterium]|nr:hypothetical protein [Chitinophagaceae bacterium]